MIADQVVENGSLGVSQDADLMGFSQAVGVFRATGVIGRIRCNGFFVSRLHEFVAESAVARV